jgi:hypothetical protein
MMVAAFLFGVVAGIATAASIAAVILVLWYGLALRAYLVER